MKRIEFKKILVTHDGSKCASAILPHVVSLGGTLNAQVILLRVIEPLVPDFGLASMSDIGPLTSSISYGVEIADLTKEVKKAATKELENVERELSKMGLKKVRHILLEGYAPEIIQYVVKKEKIDMIMMSTHGRTGLRKILLGSVAEQIIHTAPCPVFTVHPNKK